MEAHSPTLTSEGTPPRARNESAGSLDRPKLKMAGSFEAVFMVVTTGL